MHPFPRFLQRLAGQKVRLVLALLVALVGLNLPALPAAAASGGSLILGGLTAPAGGVWLTSASGAGHYWQPDSVGLSRVDPIGAQATATGFTTTGRASAAKTTSQAVVGPLQNPGAALKDQFQYVYVADASTTSQVVIRYQYMVQSDAITSAKPITVTTSGAAESRPSGLALSPDGATLYVGFIKGFGIWAATGVNSPTLSPAPTPKRVGVTSDGKQGVNGGLALFNHKDAAGTLHQDLYLGEKGGNGLSVITDVNQNCPSAGNQPCIAATVHNSAGAVVTFFPGGLAADNMYLYVGDAPLNQDATLLRFNPVTGAQETLAKQVPTYTWTESNATSHSQSTFRGISGIGLGPNGDVYVAADPTLGLATPSTLQGRLWLVAPTPVVTGISGGVAAGTSATITGYNLSNTYPALSGKTTDVTFGPNPGTGVSCTPRTYLHAEEKCTVTVPAGAGMVHVLVTNGTGGVLGTGNTSAATTADQFTYAAAPGAPAPPAVTAITPAGGPLAGGTQVTITGSGLSTAASPVPAVTFGGVAGAAVSCASATSCVATSPAQAAGTAMVDVRVATDGGTSAVVPADQFTYVPTPTASLWAYGVTAPKGGIFFAPGNLGGHYWATDHSQGICRLDTVPGTTLHALNAAVCDDGTVGSPGQGVYDAATNADGTHFVYVPDNAVRSPGVWRLTFDPATETIANPVGMAPGLMANLKTNSLALVTKADGTRDLYVGDLVDGTIRRINNVDGDPRTQTVDSVAVTTPQNTGGGTAGRGINGTMAMIGTRLFLPENNGATYFDTAAPCAAVGTKTPCTTTALNFLPATAPVFVAGIATDPARNFVYISNSSGGANATIYRFDANTITAANPGGTAGVVYATQGRVPAVGAPEATVYCSLTCTRPADPALTPGGTTGFSFAQGLVVDASGNLFITEDATAGARGGRGHIWEVTFTP